MNGYESIPRLKLGTFAIAAAVALFLPGCAEVGFPAVHDMPAPRADTTLTPDQVKQATDDLISERDHLSTEAQASGQATGTIPAANNSPGSQKRSTSAQPAAASGATQTAGAYAKP